MSSSDGETPLQGETSLSDRAVDRWFPLLPLEELPADGTGRTVELHGRRLAVFRDGEGARVLDDACPHEGASLGLGVVLESEVTCPWHGWHFRLEDGRNTDGLEECVRVYPARIGPGGQVEARLSFAEGARAEG